MKQINKQKYAELIVENRQYFYRIAYAYMKNEQDALDVVSEASYKGLVHLKALREPDYFKTWMTRIVINTATDIIRKNLRQTALEDYMLEEGSVSNWEPVINFDLYKALDALKAEEKHFIILK